MEDDDDYRQRRRSRTMSRRPSNVEMAQDEIFSGPVSESIPTMSSSFYHRRSRADSSTSFAFYEEDRDYDSEEYGEDAILDEQDDLERQSLNGENTFLEPELDPDIEDDPLRDQDSVAERRPSRGRRTSSGFSRRSIGSRGSVSIQSPLLRRQHSESSDVSGFGTGERMTQKIYILTEDLTREGWSGSG
jgi:cation-transporting P-type ATPase 13A2